MLQPGSKGSLVMVEYKSVVLKFGGSVIPNEQGICQVADVVKNLSGNYNVMAVVVSAMGKTTNNLDALAHRVATKPNLRELDALLATGEMQSAALLSMRLNQIGIPAVGYNAYQCGIKTDNNFGDAKIKQINLSQINQLCGIPVVAGFQGITENRELTTLGREGSDISAVIIAAAMGADFCWFFKNGGGIYDKNPKKEPDAKLFDVISYTKMLELLAQERGQVLHKRCVMDAMKYKMPLFVSGIDAGVGTWIVSKKHSKTH